MHICLAIENGIEAVFIQCEAAVSHDIPFRKRTSKSGGVERKSENNAPVFPRVKDESGSFELLYVLMYVLKLGGKKFYCS